MRKSLILFLFVFAVLVYSVPSRVFSEVITSDDRIEIKSNQVVDDDLFLFSEKVQMSGIVKGNLYVLAGEVEINGIIEGDVYILGGVVSVSGDIGDDVVIAGGEVTLRSVQIQGSVHLIGGTLSSSDDSVIKESLVFAGGKIDISSPVGRAVTGVAGDIFVNSVIENAVDLAGGKIELGRDADINGDFVYRSENSLKGGIESKVDGKIVRREPLSWNVGHSSVIQNSINKEVKAGMLVYSYISSLVVGFLLLFFFKKIVTSAEALLVRKPIQSGLIGLIGSILLPFVLLVLTVSLIGIPLAILLFGIALVIAYVGVFVVAVRMGHYISKTFGVGDASLYMKLALGLLVYYIILLIPGIGMVVAMVVSFSGAGAIAMWVYSKLKNQEQSEQEDRVVSIKKEPVTFS